MLDFVDLAIANTAFKRSDLPPLLGDRSVQLLNLSAQCSDLIGQMGDLLLLDLDLGFKFLHLYLVLLLLDLNLQLLDSGSMEGDLGGEGVLFLLALIDINSIEHSCL